MVELLLIEMVYGALSLIRLGVVGHLFYFAAKMEEIKEGP